MRRDPVLAAVIRRIGPCGLAEGRHPHHLSALVGAIVSQQLSARAATTIFGRLAALCPDGTVTSVEVLAALDDGALRGAGLSAQKLRYIRELCAHVAEGRLRLEELDELNDEAVVDRLSEIKGFGRWTAEMFLMFRLHRPDILPVGDLGIVTAMQRLYRLRRRPDSRRMLAIGEAWRPYRSVACWYLWQALKTEANAAARAAGAVPRAAVRTRRSRGASSTGGRSRRRSR
jgi:DNA-3-methyladenine glycosylase II